MKKRMEEDIFCEQEKRDYKHRSKDRPHVVLQRLPSRVSSTTRKTPLGFLDAKRLLLRTRRKVGMV